MSITNIDDTKLSCDICGKKEMLSDVYDSEKKNCTQYDSSMFSFDVREIGVVKHSSNVVGYKNGLRTRKEMFIQASRKYNNGIICKDCLDTIEHSSVSLKNKMKKPVNDELCSNNDISDDKLEKFNVKEWSYAICDEVENLLDEKDITIPSDDREGDPDEARLYGMEYSSLQESIEGTLTKMIREWEKFTTTN